MPSTASISPVDTPSHRSGRGYLAGVLTVGLATGLSWIFWEWIQPQVSPVFFAAIMVTAWYGGPGPGLLACALAGFVTVYLFTDPPYALHMSVADVLRLSVFLAVALVISALNSARHRAEAALRRSGADLERRVEQRTNELQHAISQLRQQVSQRTRTQADLLEYQRRLIQLATESIAAEERERRRLAMLLHDEVGQLLSGMAMKLEPLRAMDAPECAKLAEEVSEMLETAIDHTRSLTTELSPPVLYELGLGPAIQWLADRVAKQSGLNVAVDGSPEPPPLDEPIRVLLFQSVRELLNNAVKHARATKALVHMQRSVNELTIAVSDNGIGLNDADLSRPDKQSFGLFSVRERLRNVGGRLEIANSAPSGARFTLCVPMNSTTPRPVASIASESKEPSA